jgi:hypothetical protein
VVPRYRAGRPRHLALAAAPVNSNGYSPIQGSSSIACILVFNAWQGARSNNDSAPRSTDDFGFRDLTREFPSAGSEVSPHLPVFILLMSSVNPTARSRFDWPTVAWLVCPEQAEEISGPGLLQLSAISFSFIGCGIDWIVVVDVHQRILNPAGIRHHRFRATHCA